VSHELSVEREKWHMSCDRSLLMNRNIAGSGFMN
jgi:hypothetical protein